MLNEWLIFGKITFLVPYLYPEVQFGPLSLKNSDLILYLFIQCHVSLLCWYVSHSQNQGPVGIYVVLMWIKNHNKKEKKGYFRKNLPMLILLHADHALSTLWFALSSLQSSLCDLHLNSQIHTVPLLRKPHSSPTSTRLNSSNTLSVHSSFQSIASRSHAYWVRQARSR